MSEVELQSMGEVAPPSPTFETASWDEEPTHVETAAEDAGSADPQEQTQVTQPTPVAKPGADNDELANLTLEFDEPKTANVQVIVDTNAKTFTNDTVKDIDATIFLPTDDNENVLSGFHALTKGTGLERLGEWGRAALGATHTVLQHPYRVKTKYDDESIKPTVFRSALRDLDSQWDQVVESDGKRMAAAKPSWRDTEGTTLVGKKAVNRIRSLIGIGDTIRIPLWHSGFWVQLQAPGEVELTELYRALSTQKVTLGRQTYGAAFSNLSALQVEIVYDFIMRHVDATSLPSIDLIPKYLLLPDVYHLVWGLACTIWPNGFRYVRSIMAEDPAERKVIEATIALAKLQWTNTRALSDEQRRHMTRRGDGNMSIKQVEEYQAALPFSVGKDVSVEASNGCTVVLGLTVPTVIDYITSGNLWVNGIVAMVDSVLGADPNDGIRRATIEMQSRATELRTYAHYVKSIEVHRDGELINRTEDAGARDELLANFGVDKKIRAAYIKGVRDFIDDSVVSIIGIPALRGEDHLSLPNFSMLVPIDTIGVFFDLLMQRVQANVIEALE